MKNLLFLTYDVPNPTEGSTIRMYYFIKNLSLDYSINLISFVQSDHSKKYCKDIKKFCTHSQFLESKYSTKNIKLYFTNNFRNLFSFASNRHPIGKFDPLSSFYDSQMERYINKFINTHSVDAVISDHNMAYYVANLDKPKIVDAVDCISNVLEDFYSNSKNKKEKFFWKIQTLREIWKEKNVYNHYDKVLVVTDEDKKMLSNNVKNEKIITLPNGVDTSYFRPFFKFEEYPSIAYLGHMGDKKNLDTVLYFYERIYPVIKEQFPEIKFYLIGRDPCREILSLRNKDPSVIITGYVKDVREHLSKASVFVAPVRIGSGIKNKVLEAMAMGKPVVTTSIGALGIDAKNGTHMFIEDDPFKFAEIVIELLKNENLRYDIGKNGRRLVDDKFSWISTVNHLNIILRNLLK